jgi:hypothetical protein
MAIRTPDTVSPSVRSRSNAWKHIGDHWIRITFLDDGAAVVVITVTVRRRGPSEV